MLLLAYSFWIIFLDYNDLSKFRARPHDTFFSWTFDLILINSSKFIYLLFLVCSSLHRRNTVYKYKLRRKPIMKEIQAHIFSFDIEQSNYCHVELKCLISNFSFFSVLWTHFLKLIKQPFRRGVNLIFFFSIPLTNIVWCIKSQTCLLIYLSSIVSFFQITPSACAL